jgi:hypothetical protein
MTTGTLEPMDLHRLLTGLDVLDGLDTGDTAAQTQMTDHLLHQGQAQGVPLTRREAQLVAKLVLAPVPPKRERIDEGRALSSTDVRSFFQFPSLVRTPEEQQAERASRRQPRRWWRCLRQGLLSFGVAVASVVGGRWLNDWNQHTHVLDAYSLSDPLVMVAIAVAIVGIVTGLFSMGELFLDRDTSLYQARMKQAYQTRLDALTDLQLAQVHAAVLIESGTQNPRLSPESVLVPMVKTAMAARQSQTSSL